MRSAVGTVPWHPLAAEEDEEQQTGEGPSHMHFCRKVRCFISTGKENEWEYEHVRRQGALFCTFRIERNDDAMPRDTLKRSGRYHTLLDG